jgi:hypothetical protein
VAEVDPRSSPTFLGGEEIDDTEEREAQAQKWRAELDRLAQREELFTLPAWEALTAELREKLRTNQEALLTTLLPHEPQHDAVLRGAVREIRWVLGLPEATKRTRDTLLADLAELEASPDEEGSD